MWRTTSFAATALAVLLTACGGGTDRPTATERPDGPQRVQRLTAEQAGAQTDPCPTARRPRPPGGQGGCIFELADRVVGRDQTLRLSGVTARIRDVRLAADAVVGGVRQRPTLASGFLVVRLTIENRRRSRMTLKPSDLHSVVLAGQAPAAVLTTVEAKDAIGPAHSELRFAPGAVGQVVALFPFGRESEVLLPDHVRIALYLPDRPGTPKHGPFRSKRGPGRHERILDRRLGVFRLSR